MSSDNGVYILPSPKKNGGLEYRVVHAQAIENIDYPGLEEPYEIMYFNRSETFDDREEAIKVAHQIAKHINPLEYGVQILPEREHYFPEMTEDEAKLKLNMSWFDIASADVKQQVKDLFENGYSIKFICNTGKAVLYRDEKQVEINF